jgi:nicotinate-nucleotide--dimethylbenzimidazole phosphoribosyltransferase
MFKVPSIDKVDQTFAPLAQKRLESLAIPRGALGNLGSLAVKLMTFSKSLTPSFSQRELFLCAADHGIAVNGVSQYPQITDKILSCASHSGAVINALCKSQSCDLKLINCGLLNETESGGINIINMSMGLKGTKDFSKEAAMTAEQCQQALANGMNLLENSSAELILLGEMGIGNTSSATAMFAKLYELKAHECVGAGTGLDKQGIEHKARIIQEGLKRFSIKNLSREERAFEVLRQVGGLELATLVGVCLAAAQKQKIILLDGFLSAVVALVAKEFCPHVVDYMIASHVSHEQAHQHSLQILGKTPLLDLKMCLGEGSGAVLALPLIDSVCAILKETMTLDEALNV